LEFNFELMADDYIAASSSSNTTGRVIHSYLPYALLLTLVFWILLRDAVSVPFLQATLTATALLLGMFAYHAVTWRKRFEHMLRRYYGGPRRSILGPHTLELTAAGLNSKGPLHRSFRAWAAITGAVVTHSHVFFQTLFGIVYVLPLRAVDNAGALIVSLTGEYGVTVSDCRENSSGKNAR
jgi:hypothetical protein